MMNKFTCLFNDMLKTLAVLFCQRIVLLSNCKPDQTMLNAKTVQPFYCP